MNNETIKVILELNKNFYESSAEEFNTSRQYPWKGWGRVLKILSEHFAEYNIVKILDVGCGNGRFFKFLSKTELSRKVIYLGIDSNPRLINLAQNIDTSYSKAKFSIVDVISNTDNINGRYDTIVIFGVSHHVPGKKKREKWFLDIASHVNQKGLLITTFWNFNLDKTQIDAQPEISSIKLELEDNDYILGWMDKENIKRYAHLYTKDELTEITNLLRNMNFELVDRFTSDGKNNLSNTYLFWKKL